MHLLHFTENIITLFTFHRNCWPWRNTSDEGTAQLTQQKHSLRTSIQQRITRIIAGREHELTILHSTLCGSAIQPGKISSTQGYNRMNDSDLRTSATTCITRNRRHRRRARDPLHHLQFLVRHQPHGTTFYKEITRKLVEKQDGRALRGAPWTPRNPTGATRFATPLTPSVPSAPSTDDLEEFEDTW